LNKNTTVTLLATKPRTGFYHVQTASGQKGWVGVKYLTVEGEAGTETAPTSPTTPAPAAAGCDASLWNHVYNKTRLTVIQPCATVTGTLHIVRPEADGDVHMQLTLDPQFNNMLNAINRSKQHNSLVIERMCAHTPTQPDAIAACEGFTQEFPALTEGARIKVTGAYVLDHDPGHGWNEIHPITAVEAVP